jgi:hypothetical protein
MKQIGVILMILLLSACAAARWEHPERTVLQEEQDRYVCEDQIYKEHPNWRQMRGEEKQSLVDECMVSKGYRRAA